MLIGQFEAKLGVKGRVAFPAKFRKELGDKLIITLGYENSLIVVSESEWKTLLEGTEGKPFIQSETRETQRFLLGGAVEVELDSKGRFILPSFLRQFAKIEGEIVFLGLSRYIEIWDKKSWEEYRKKLEGKIVRVSQRLVEKDSPEAKQRKNG